MKVKEMIKKIKSRLTMKSTGKSFIDVVTGDLIQYWIDCYGNEWLSISKWGFRVKIKSINL